MANCINIECFYIEIPDRYTDRNFGPSYLTNYQRSIIGTCQYSYTIRPGSVDSLNGGSTDAMKKAPVEK